MTRKWKIIVALLIALPLLAGATCVKAVANAMTEKMPHYGPCPSAAEAKQLGICVCDVAVAPVRGTWQGNDFAIKEAWVEEVAERTHFLVWFPYCKRTGEKCLCFTLAEGQELFLPGNAKPHPWFKLDGKLSRSSFFGVSFNHGEPATFCHYSDAAYSFPINMGIAPDSQKPVDAYNITLTAKPKAGWIR
jgi:hypothetical protein